MLYSQTSGTTSVVTSNFEKKEITIGMKVQETIRRQIEEIAADEDRPVGYVARELMIRGIALYRLDGKLRDESLPLNLGSIDEFGLTKALAESDDPHHIMKEWFAFEGRKMPRDYSVIFFNGWETFSPDDKAEALKDAKKVLDRSLRSRDKKKLKGEKAQ